MRATGVVEGRSSTIVADVRPAYGIASALRPVLFSHAWATTERGFDFYAFA